MSERTLRHWVRTYAPGAMLRRQGYGSGAEAIYRGLRGAVPLRLVRWAARGLKERHARRRAERRARERVSVRARWKDTLWSLDATHLGWDGGRAVQGQVVRDLCTPRMLAASVGPPVRSGDVLRLLEVARRERGRLPLVLITDNGSPYTSTRVEKYLERERVLHLRNLPRTPEHNAWTECALGQLKEDTPFGRGVPTHVLDAAAHLAASFLRLNRHKLRRSLGWKTA